MTGLDTLLNHMASRVAEQTIDERIPRSLPLDVAESFHVCEVERMGRHALSHYLKHIGVVKSSRRDTVGDVIAFTHMLKAEPAKALPIMETLRAEDYPDTQPFESADAQVFKVFAAKQLLVVAHSLTWLNGLSLKMLCLATVSDIWQSTEATFGAVRKLEDWGKPIGDMITCGYTLLNDTAIDGGRNEDDDAYWRDGLIRMIGVRSTYLDAIEPSLDYVIERIREEERKKMFELTDQLRGLFGGLSGRAAQSDDDVAPRIISVVAPPPDSVQ